MFRHIVFFHFRKDVSAVLKEKALACLRDLGSDNEAIIEWSIVESQDTRKGIIIVENALFSSEEAFKDFHASLKHTNAAKIMSEISDWWIGDYFEADGKGKK